MSPINFNGSFYGFPISSKSKARDGRTDRRTDGGAKLNAAFHRESRDNCIANETVSNWQAD